jgi:hypothetical protein
MFISFLKAKKQRYSIHIHHSYNMQTTSLFLFNSSSTFSDKSSPEVKVGSSAVMWTLLIHDDFRITLRKWGDVDGGVDVGNEDEGGDGKSADGEGEDSEGDEGKGGEGEDDESEDDEDDG